MGLFRRAAKLSVLPVALRRQPANHVRPHVAVCRARVMPVQVCPLPVRRAAARVSRAGNGEPQTPAARQSCSASQQVPQTRYATASGHWETR